jgi:deazaflavin-dependent oxidoreductase (nitroreductase family)
MSSPAEFNSQIIDEFRANEGRVGGMFESMPLLLLHHRGAKSGSERINPVAYLADDGRYVVIASKGGAPSNPAWYYNLKANPEVKIEVGTEMLDAVAREATGEERERLFRAQADRFPQFDDYVVKAGGRTIPVFVITPREG